MMKKPGERKLSLFLTTDFAQYSTQSASTL